MIQPHSLLPAIVAIASLLAQDPAPPVAVTLEPIDPPAALDYDELTFHAAPRPLADDAITEDWPGFLGPRRDGRSRETGLLQKWPTTGPRLVWSMVRGEGFASPAISAGRVVFPHRLDATTHVDCLDAETGRRFWRYSFATDYRGIYITDSGPRATPLIDGDRVYVHGVEGTLHCLELTTGRVVWRRDPKTEFELGDDFFGVVGSPLIVGDLLICNLERPTVVAFDKHDGKLRWRTDHKWGMSCASTVLGRIGDRDRLLVLAGGESRPPTGGLLIVDPADGSLEFEYSFRSRTVESVLGATPVVTAAGVFLTASYNTGAAVVGLGDDGYHELWRKRQPAIEFSTPLYVDGHLFLVDGVRERAGAIVCLDPATGAELARTDLAWDQDVEVGGERKSLAMSIGNGSLLWADGTFLCLSDYGHLLRLRCTAAGTEVLDRATLFLATESWTPPVLAQGLLYVCQNRRSRYGDQPPRLLCYDLRGGD